MYAVMREYSGDGAKGLLDLLENKKAEVKDVIMAVKGFVSYSLVRTARGGFSVTICQDKAGVDESVRVARLDRKERERCWRGRTNGLGRHSHLALVGSWMGFVKAKALSLAHLAPATWQC